MYVAIVVSGVLHWLFFFFFFQAEDGIRDIGVTGVQTCALPIWGPRSQPVRWWWHPGSAPGRPVHRDGAEPRRGADPVRGPHPTPAPGRRFRPTGRGARRRTRGWR